MKYIVLFMLALFVVFPAFAGKERLSAYDRVTETGTIRCGYLVYKPFIMKDPNTGELSGLTVDYINEVGKRIGVDVEWTTEFNIDQVVTSVEGGRFDVICVPITPDENWERVIGFAGYIGALPYYIYVPYDSEATKESLQEGQFAVVDGYALTEITKQEFPNAEYRSLTQTTSTGEMFDQLRYKKVDAHINENISARNYMENNPGTIKRLSADPVIAMKMYLGTAKADQKMQDFMQENFAADHPENLAIYREITKKYGVSEGSLLLDECSKFVETEKKWQVCAEYE